MRTLFALLLVAVLVLGGCSYGDDDGDNTGGGYGALGVASAAIS